MLISSSKNQWISAVSGFIEKLVFLVAVIAKLPPFTLFKLTVTSFKSAAAKIFLITFKE